MLDLYHHAQHCYSTTLSHTANCCGSDKLIWTVSCISHNISHPPCCKLAQVVALSSPPFNVKRSVWLLSSCNAAPLIAKVTTQQRSGLPSAHQTVPDTRIVLLSSGRTGFVGCTAAEGILSDAKHKLGLCLTYQTVGFSFSGANWEFTATRSFPQLPQCKLCPSNGHTKCHCLSPSKTVDT
jgi:hypothetical protein